MYMTKNALKVVLPSTTASLSVHCGISFHHSISSFHYSISVCSLWHLFPSQYLFLPLQYLVCDDISPDRKRPFCRFFVWVYFSSGNSEALQQHAVFSSEYVVLSDVQDIRNVKMYCVFIFTYSRAYSVHVYMCLYAFSRCTFHCTVHAYVQVSMLLYSTYNKTSIVTKSLQYVHGLVLVEIYFRILLQTIISALSVCCC